ncbi:MAG: hypothetical protein ABR613_09550 [Actinomycetota bacterium]
MPDPDDPTYPEILGIPVNALRRPQAITFPVTPSGLGAPRSRDRDAEGPRGFARTDRVPAAPADPEQVLDPPSVTAARLMRSKHLVDPRRDERSPQPEPEFRRVRVRVRRPRTYVAVEVAARRAAERQDILAADAISV